MEQKAKRVGKFNIVDIIAVILIVAVVVFAGYKLLGNRGGGVAAEPEMTKVTYVVRVEGVAAELYENCLENLPSPLMASGALVGVGAAVGAGVAAGTAVFSEFCSLVLGFGSSFLGV